MKDNTFNFAHISDVHLGYSSGKRIAGIGTNLRVLDGYQAWHEAITQMLEEHKNNPLDAVIVSGDIFHMAHPDIRTIMEAQEGLRRLAREGIKVYVGAGNHDATDIRAEIPANGVLDEPNFGIRSYTEPYIVEEIKPGYFFHFLNHHAYTDQGETMKQIKLIDGAINVLVSHGSCFDTNMNVVLHCPQEPREVVIPEFVIDMPWDYTILGHIHERGWIGSKDGVSDSAKRKQFYGGSVIRRGFTDRPCKLGRGWTLWSIDEDRVFTPEFFSVHQRPQIDCKEINATNLTPLEVEEKLVEQVKSIYDKYKNKDGRISDEFAPIVRQTVTNLSPVAYLSIDWSRSAKYRNHFLTYTLKRVESPQETEDNNEDTEKKAFSSKKDITEAFSEWVKSRYEESKIENKDKVIEQARKLLQLGQNKVLDNGEE